MSGLTQVLATTIKEITKEEKVAKEKILLATSFCSDELNHQGKEFEHVKAVFQLGGLAGFPYAGVTGLNAFLSHVPSDGAAILMYGPHIGKNKTGKFGYVQRPFQPEESTSCGALMTLLDYFQPTAHKHNIDMREADIQFDYLRKKLYDLQDIISNKDIEKLTREVYELIHKDVLNVVEKSNFKDYGFPMYLLGGIIINEHDGNRFELISSRKA